MHACIFGCEFESDIVVGTALINLYGKCGTMENAQSVFRAMPKRDVTSWNSMLAIYAKHNQCKNALQLYDVMLKEEVKPDQATFVSLLDACANQVDLDEGKQMHQNIVTSGFDSDIFVSTALVNMYAKCGSLRHAWLMFDKIVNRDIVAWNAMIEACAQHGEDKDALQLFKLMQQDGVVPNQVTFPSLLQACVIQGKLCEGKRIHDIVRVRGFESDVAVGTALVTMYGKCGSFKDARRLFMKMPERNLVSWNAMIAVCAQNKQAFQLFEQMQQVGELPNRVTFLGVLSVCDNKTALGVGKQMHARIASNGLNSDVAVGSALISMYGKCGHFEDAQVVFDDLPERDVVSWTAMMSVYAQHGLYRNAFLLFEQMQQDGITLDKTTFVILLSGYSSPTALDEGKQMHEHVATSGFESNVDVANALISMYDKCSSLEDALMVFDQMHTRDALTFVSVLSACASHAALSDGKLTHQQIIEDGLLFDTVLENAVINMYGKCGCMEEAQSVFDLVQARDVVSWSTMMQAYAQHGQGRKALWLFDCMQHEAVVPNDVTFLGVLSACNHSGLIDDGWHYFVSMSQDYGVVPTEDHYHCMVDLLGRSGQLEEAENMILRMPCKAEGVSWLMLLGACRYHGDEARGGRAAQRALELDPRNPLPYVMLANIYATVGREDDAANMIKKMNDKRLTKDISFEGKGKVHQILVYDQSNPEKEQIYCGG